MKVVVILLSVCLSVLSYEATAVPVVGSFADQKGEKKARKVNSSKQAVQMAVNRFGGKVLKVQANVANGQQGYKVKLIQNSGNIVTVFVNAKTGRLIKY